MRQLYHFNLSPECRLVRMALAEKKLQCTYVAVELNQLPAAVWQLSPRGQLPLFIDEDGTAIAGAGAITEYLEETYPLDKLIGSTTAARSETRSLFDWLTTCFACEVTHKLYGERLLKRVSRVGAPDSRAIRDGLARIPAYLEWIGAQCELRRWLAGDDLTLADLYMAAQLSVIDYLGDVPWHDFPGAKTWYSRLKSRPSFRPLLTDIFPGLPPAAHYADLDF